MPVIKAPANLTKWTQIIHIEKNDFGMPCNGEVVAVITLDKRELRYGCKKCQSVWLEISGSFPDHIFKLHGVDNGIIKPPKDFKM
jgi:hypothetical protein